MTNLEMDDLQKKYDKLKKTFDKVSEDIIIEREEHAIVKESQ